MHSLLVVLLGSVLVVLLLVLLVAVLSVLPSLHPLLAHIWLNNNQDWP
ncbi:hypothetical protein FACS189485_02570 [Spirochaetia bacterium]|nr:hypothetical protein FACS189485_02570 [Spirochaetia bacterium]